ncbi:Asr1405/Asl0597 family protein [Thermocoleostomius sinensis]|jgi:hypothetical protein|uniref:Uncharacterized protein n=1 Tax=Thermocoleostomius sinensis A174 TaxID=2016057 RepID=A0A9E9C8N8_9CYAN|nr:Asr1405/Asl0597 family protein [Thermocoleostomius sinensis]WAL61609.1 hypothetical protein OXH18_06385 [Thermocoleostomius sinensis A174]
MDQLSPQSSSSADRSPQIISIPRCDRWQAYHRLQELHIPCICLEDGRLQVEITSPHAAVQLWSVMQQLTRPRQQLSNWLERCWHM